MMKYRDIDSLNEAMKKQYSKYAEDIIRNMKFDNSPKVQNIQEKIKQLAEKLELTDKGLRTLRSQNIFIVCIVLRKYKTKLEHKTTQIIRKGIHEQRLFWPKGFVHYLQKFLDE